jgi:hypothetical protein
MIPEQTYSTLRSNTAFDAFVKDFLTKHRPVRCMCNGSLNCPVPGAPSSVEDSLLYHVDRSDYSSSSSALSSSRTTEAVLRRRPQAPAPDADDLLARVLREAGCCERKGA